MGVVWLSRIGCCGMGMVIWLGVGRVGSGVLSMVGSIFARRVLAGDNDFGLAF